MAKIYAPNKRYTGLIAGVSFSNGVGKTENKYLISWFEEKGYEILEDSPQSGETLIQDIVEAYDLALIEDNTRELDKLTVPKLKALLDEKGIDYNSKAKKDELLRVLEGE